MKARFVVHGEPKGKGRPRLGKGGHTYTPKDTTMYENLVKVEYQSQCGGIKFGDKVPLDARVTAYYKIPKSITKKERNEMTANILRPCKKPDIDNVIKAIFDSLNHIAYYDENNTEKIDESVFVSRMYEQLPSFEAYTLHNCIVSNDGQTAYVLADYNLRFSGEIMEYINIPVKIVKENDIWKIQFSRFEALFLGL